MSGCQTSVRKLDAMQHERIGRIGPGHQWHGRDGSCNPSGPQSYPRIEQPARPGAEHLTVSVPTGNSFAGANSATAAATTSAAAASRTLVKASSRPASGGLALAGWLLQLAGTGSTLVQPQCRHSCCLLAGCSAAAAELCVTAITCKRTPHLASDDDDDDDNVWTVSYVRLGLMERLCRRNRGPRMRICGGRIGTLTRMWEQMASHGRTATSTSSVWRSRGSYQQVSRGRRSSSRRWCRMWTTRRTIRGWRGQARSHLRTSVSRKRRRCGGMHPRLSCRWLCRRGTGGY